MTTFSRRSLLAASACAALAICGAAQAQGSGAPVRLLVGYSAGGPVDQGARLFAIALSKELGQTVVVENKTGANATASKLTVLATALHAPLAAKVSGAVDGPATVTTS